MYRAFTSDKLINDFPYAIESIACYDNYLLVGTKNGYFLRYSVQPNVALPHRNSSSSLRGSNSTTTRTSSKPTVPNSASVPHQMRAFDMQPDISIHDFSKKPVLQMYPLSEVRRLLVLTGGMVCMYDLQQGQFICNLPRTKGATVFCVLKGASPFPMDSKPPPMNDHTDTISLNTDMDRKFGGAAGHLSKITTSLTNFVPFGGGGGGGNSGSTSNDSSRRGSTSNFAFKGGAADTTSPPVEMWLCVGLGSRHRILLYRWSSAREFVEVPGYEFSVPESPRCLYMVPGAIYVGMRTEYFMIRLPDGEPEQVILCGRNQHPILCPLIDEPRGTSSSSERATGNSSNTGRGLVSQLLLVQNEDSALLHTSNPFYVNSTTSTSLHAWIPPSTTVYDKVRWTEPPMGMDYCQPYVMAVLSNYVEVRCLAPKMIIQSMTLDKGLHLICHHGDRVFVASPSCIWLLHCVDKEEHLQELMANKEYELALRVFETMRFKSPSSSSHSADAAAGRLSGRAIRNQLAFQLHLSGEYEESLRLFSELETDPIHVLGLFPTLLPERVRQKMLAQTGIISQQGTGDLEKALQPLITYLISWRNRLRKVSNNEVNTRVQTYPIQDGLDTTTDRQLLLQIVDTSLLKVYLEVNHALIAPLLRRENNVHLEEAERCLIEANCLRELIVLYYNRGLHQRALFKLSSCVRNKTSGLYGHQHLVRYLQRLGPTHLDLVFKYSDWLLKEYPKAALNIFTRWEDRCQQQQQQNHVWRRSPDDEMPAAAKSLDVGDNLLPAEDDDVRCISFTQSYRNQVLKHLEEYAPDLVIPYLEMVIFERTAHHEEEAAGLQSPGNSNVASNNSVYRRTTLGITGRSASSASRGRTTTDPESSEEEELFTGDDTTSVGKGSITEQNNTVVKRTDTDNEQTVWLLEPFAQVILAPDAATDVVLGTNSTDTQSITAGNLTMVTYLHNRYADALRKRIMFVAEKNQLNLQQLNVSSSSDGPWSASATDVKVIHFLRRKLVCFLESQQAHYSPDYLLAYFPANCFLEERAILLARYGQHEKALGIWVHVLHDWQRAENHCQQVYKNAITNTSPSSSVLSTAIAPKDIYLSLLRLCLEPCSPESLGVQLPTDWLSDSSGASSGIPLRPFPLQIDRAVDILRMHGSKIDPLQVMKILPEETHTCKLQPYFHEIMGCMSRQLVQLDFLNKLYYSQKLQSSQERMEKASQRRFTLYESTRCKECNKTIGHSAFARYPNGDVVHYGCCRELINASATTGGPTSGRAT